MAYALAAAAASCASLERTDTWTTSVVPTWVAVTDGAPGRLLSTRAATAELSMTSIPSGTFGTGAMLAGEFASMSVWEMGGSRSTEAVPS